MRSFGTFLFALMMTVVVQGQEKKTMFSYMSRNNILNHLDIGVGVSTVGLNVDLALPVTNYARIRAGYSYMPPINIHSKFPIGTRSGSIGDMTGKVAMIDKMLAQYNIDLNSEGFEDFKLMYDKFRNIEVKDYVTLGLKPNMHQFKFLVDVMPFKRNKHWSLTLGFFVGSPNVGSASNLDEETPILEAVNAYNKIYADYPAKGIKGTWLNKGYEDAVNDPFYRYGVAGFPLGKFSDGDLALMIPSEDATARAEMELNKFRPYVGLNYNTHLSRNKKWNLNVDAGVLFICGKPSVYVDNVLKIDASPLKGYLDENSENFDYVYESGIGIDPYWFNYYGDIVRFNSQTQKYESCADLRSHVDLMRDLHDMPAGKVRDMVNTISKLKVYPNLSVTVSYRLY